MLIPILAIIGVIVVILVIVISMRPAGFILTRSATMSAPPQVIFEKVNNLHKWEAWSPWDKIDPAIKRTYGGSAAGIGATYHWLGNKKVGEGHMTIVESRPPEVIRLKLEFLKPFKATNTTEFVFKPSGSQTAVTWSMSGKNNFMSKAFQMFVDFDKMVGKDFEKGLAQLKTLVESSNR